MDLFTRKKLFKIAYVGGAMQLKLVGIYDGTEIYNTEMLTKEQEIDCIENGKSYFLGIPPVIIVTGRKVRELTDKEWPKALEYFKDKPLNKTPEQIKLEEDFADFAKYMSAKEADEDDEY